MNRSMHDITYTTVCNILDTIATPFKRFIEKCSPVDLERALEHRSSFMLFHPFNQFTCKLPNVTYSFVEDCQWWETHFGVNEGERYAILLFDEVKQMIEDMQAERAKESDKPAKGDLAA